MDKTTNKEISIQTILIVFLLNINIWYHEIIKFKNIYCSDGHCCFMVNLFFNRS